MLDQRGVGELVKLATERGRKTRPNLKVSFGTCGHCLVSLEIMVSLFGAVLQTGGHLWRTWWGASVSCFLRKGWAGLCFLLPFQVGQEINS